MFQKHICPNGAKFRFIFTSSKQVIKGLKYIKWTTHWAQKSGMTLTFEHVT